MGHLYACFHGININSVLLFIFFVLIRIKNSKDSIQIKFLHFAELLHIITFPSARTSPLLALEHTVFFLNMLIDKCKSYVTESSININKEKKNMFQIEFWLITSFNEINSFFSLCYFLLLNHAYRTHDYIIRMWVKCIILLYSLDTYTIN